MDGQTWWLPSFLDDRRPPANELEIREHQLRRTQGVPSI
jgi:hypothetical protein